MESAGECLFAPETALLERLFPQQLVTERVNPTPPSPSPFLIAAYPVAVGSRLVPPEAGATWSGYCSNRYPHAGPKSWTLLHGGSYGGRSRDITGRQC